MIVLYVALAIVMLRAIGRARDRFGKAVIGGILVWIVGQAFVNMAVVMNLLPSLGVPLPLISAGAVSYTHLDVYKRQARDEVRGALREAGMLE